MWERTWLQFMCMQPEFFSIGRLHLGHGLVLARIQFRFSLSALFLRIHRSTILQDTYRTAPALVEAAPSGVIDEAEMVLATYV